MYDAAGKRDSEWRSLALGAHRSLHEPYLLALREMRRA